LLTLAPLDEGIGPHNVGPGDDVGNNALARLTEGQAAVEDEA
jgi:hypothetical protein